MEDLTSNAKRVIKSLKIALLGAQPLSGVSGLTFVFFCLMPPYVWVLSAKPFSVEWSTVGVIILGELVIIVMQIPERLHEVTRRQERSRKTEKNSTSPLIQIEDIALDYKEVGALMLLFQDETAIGIFGIPADIFERYQLIYSVVIGALVVYSMLRNLKGPILNLRKFNLVELAYHLIIVLKCRPVEFVMHFLLMQSFMKCTSYFLRKTAGLLLSKAPPEIRTISQKYLKNFL